MAQNRRSRFQDINPHGGRAGEGIGNGRGGIGHAGHVYPAIHRVKGAGGREERRSIIFRLSLISIAEADGRGWLSLLLQPETTFRRLSMNDPLRKKSHFPPPFLCASSAATETLHWIFWGRRKKVVNKTTEEELRGDYSLQRGINVGQKNSTWHTKKSRDHTW